MADHPNLTIMKRTLQAFQTGDVPTLGQLMAPDVVWRLPGKRVLSGDYRGQQAVFGLFGRLMELTGGTFKVESLDILANDRGGVLIDRLTAEREGRSLDIRVMLHLTIRDGLIVEGTDYFRPEHLWDAFWA
ncbi:MAG: nuclear transport factor 2 family protein [Vicinamibacterales bacterium]